MQLFVMYKMNEDEVGKLISQINPNKSCGIDLVDPFIIKQFASSLAPILSNIFDKSINIGRVPNKVKATIILGL